MLLPAAILKLLDMAKCPQSVSEVTTALLEGGFKTTSKNFTPLVSSNLSRLKATGELVNVEGKWGIASWYPAVRKAELSGKSKNEHKRKHDKSSVARRTAKAAISRPTPEQVERIKTLHGAGKKLSDIAKEVRLHHLAVWGILKLRKPVAA